MRKNKVIISTLFLAALCMASLASAQCSLRTLTPQDNKIVIDGTTMASLGEGDDPVQAKAWLGPLHAGRCTFDIGIIEQPIALTQNGQLYVTTYSGSNVQIGLYDLKTCTVRWLSEKIGDLELTPATLKLDDKTLPLGADCVPVERKNSRSAQ